jgi:hypothetical protein
MATLGITRIEPVRTISGNEPQTAWYPEAATQTFLQGAVLTFNASGFVVEATSNNTIGGGTEPGRLLGIAAIPGLNLTTAATPPSLPPIGSPTGGQSGFSSCVWVANQDTIFRANFCFTNGSGVAATAASSNFGAGTAASPGLVLVGNYPIVGGMYGITKLTAAPGTGNWIVDAAKNTRAQARVIVVSFDPRGSSYPLDSDTFPIVDFMFVSQFTAFGMTS